MKSEQEIIEEIIYSSVCPYNTEKDGADYNVLDCACPDCFKLVIKKTLQKGKELGNQINICSTHSMARVACQKCYQTDLNLNLKDITREKDELHSQNSQLIDDMNDQASKIAELEERLRISKIQYDADRGHILSLSTANRELKEASQKWMEKSTRLSKEVALLQEEKKIIFEELWASISEARLEKFGKLTKSAKWHIEHLAIIIRNLEDPKVIKLIKKSKTEKLKGETKL